jgi:hypothetical protein
MLRLPLKESAERDDVDSLAVDHNWMLYDVIPRTEETPRETIWLTEDEAVTIHFIEDHLIDINYFLLEGVSDRVQKISELIQSNLQIYSLKEIESFAKTASNENDIIRALYYSAACSSSSFNKNLFSIIKSGIESEEGEVRRAAIVAMGYLAWPEVKSYLEALRDNDLDKKVRRDAKLMLEGLISEVWSKEETK